MLLTTALDKVQETEFTVTYITHDKERKKGGQVRTLNNVVILGSKLWWELYQLSFGTNRQPTQLEKENIQVATGTSPKDKRPRDYINVVSVISGRLDSSFPNKICIHLITAINGQEIFI